MLVGDNSKPLDINQCYVPRFTFSHTIVEEKGETKEGWCVCGGGRGPANGKEGRKEGRKVDGV